MPAMATGDVLASGDDRVVLTGERVRLRAPRPADVHDRVRNGRHSEIVLMYGGDVTTVSPSISVQEAEQWVLGLRSHPHAWVIEFRGECVGEIRLDGVTTADRRAVLAVGLLHPDHLGRGLGSDAVATVLDHAFGPMGLHRVSLRVLAYNRRAIAAYEKVGFVIEGRERESAWVGGQWHDDVVMGVLETDRRLPRPARASPRPQR
jgi:RimJ/RimL family protein N-acetyltransferase